MELKSFKKIKLPNSPGVYFFLGSPKGTKGGYKGKSILYIGKATSLKDRVKSYFGKDLIETRGPLLVDMVFHADNIKFEKTDSVLEALILEAELIKKYQPKYNTKEKSDKSFNYVCVTKGARSDILDLPKVIIVRGKDLKNFSGNFFGPFPNSSQLREALKIVRRIFPFLDDKSKNYLEFYKQINLVPDLQDTEMYLKNIKNIKLFFQGKKKEILRNLKKEMTAYAKARAFEKAGELKRQIFALQHINDIALMKYTPNSRSLSGDKLFRIEAYDIAHMSGKNMVGVMTVLEDGQVQKSEYKKFKIRTQADANDTGALREVLERRLAHSEWTLPDLIVVDGGVAQINVTHKVLKEMKMDIRIVSVLKDERHKPKDIMGDRESAMKYRKEILLANSEAHRFAIAYHKNMRNKNFLQKVSK